MYINILYISHPANVAFCKSSKRLNGLLHLEDDSGLWFTKYGRSPFPVLDTNNNYTFFLVGDSYT